MSRTCIRMLRADARSHIKFASSIFHLFDQEVDRWTTEAIGLSSTAKTTSIFYTTTLYSTHFTLPHNVHLVVDMHAKNTIAHDTQKHEYFWLHTHIHTHAHARRHSIHGKALSFCQNHSYTYMYYRCIYMSLLWLWPDCYSSFVFRVQLFLSISVVHKFVRIFWLLFVSLISVFPWAQV